MNMLLNESKEMLKDPVTEDYLIDYSLNLCYSNNIEPIVISRIEKEELNSYLRQKGVEYIVLKTPGKEWAETVLKSQGLWGDKNILLLPDTRFNKNAIKDILSKVDGSLVIGYHEIDPMESNKWGIITEDNLILEKSLTRRSEKAWGLIGFNKPDGIWFLEEISEYKSFPLTKYEKFVKLDYFKDITRTGQLEKY